jgi:hypothetical protein
MGIDTPYAANIRFTELLERGKAQTTELKIFRSGAQIIPASGLYSLQKPGSGFIVEDVAVAVAVSGTCSYTHSAGQLAATLELGEGYVQQWKLTISGEEYIFRRMVSLVLRRLYPVIYDSDLTNVYSNLNDLRPSSLTSWQSYIDDAWFQIIRKIRGSGAGFEYLITSPSALFDVHRHLTLYLIFRDFHSSLGQSNGRYLDLATEHNRAFHQEWDSISWIYDASHNGTPDDPNKRTRGEPSIFLTRPGNYTRSWF